MKDTDMNEGSLWRWIAVSGVVAVVVCVVWLTSWALITRQLGNPTDPAGFGDMFGAVNALFSGLAFAGVILAILMQREELKFQRKELTLSTKAQEAQERALIISAQLNANVALLEHQEILRQEARDDGDYDPQSDKEWQNARMSEIFRLLQELRGTTNTH